MRILIVEDEARLVTILRRGLMEEGHAVDIALSGEEALDWIDATSFDAIILDVMLPGIDGLEVCRQLRNRRVQIPILLLTVRNTVSDRVAGLDAGADDYLAKPFAFAELTARLRALARRPAETLETILNVAGVRLDPATRRVWREGQEVILSNKEFRILECLLRHPNHVLTRQMIADQVWDYDARDVGNVIDVHIRSIRHKLDDPYPGTLIQTVRGVGYRFAAA